jgi:hypothetical protein
MFRCLDHVAQFSRRAGELAGLRSHHFVRESQEQVAHRTRHYRVLAGLEAAGVTCQERGHAAGLVGVGFGVLVHINEQGVIEQGAFAFWNRLQFRQQVGALLDVPAIDMRMMRWFSGAAASWCV